MNRRPIYVETLIRCDLEQLWALTQEPDQHQRWDVRFGAIAYLPRVEGAAQRFTYTTTVAPGVRIRGTGEALGDRDRADGSSWSGLRFWADDSRSLIARGGGHWRYLPTPDGVLFLTRYDYLPRWGRLGRVLDRGIFRPVFGWATAWSFDRLRLWAELGIPPERARNGWLAHRFAGAAALGLAVTSAAGWGRPGPAAPALLGLALALGLAAMTGRSRRPSGRRPRRTPPARRPARVVGS